MSREIPEVVRAAAGLAATVLDEARRLPETLPGLPVRLIGMAMQHAMKAQQQYAGLVARGDELFTGLRGEAEPGLATFDDDDAVAPVTGFRGSAFDRVGGETIPDAEIAELPEDLAADAVTGVVDALADRVGAQDTLDELADEAPATEEILDELAIDEAIEAAPDLAQTAPPVRGGTEETAVPVTGDADALESALLESGDAPAATLPVAGAADAEPVDVPTTVDVLTPDGGDVTTVDAAVTDEGIATPVTDEDIAVATGESVAETDGTAAGDVARGDGPVATAAGVDADVEVGGAGTDGENAALSADAVNAGAQTAEPSDDPQAGSEVPGPPEVGAAPIDGYDTFTIAQLRGRLRGYTLHTVSDLVAYEEATRAREPYLRMLRNRLEKLEEQAVESSPLAPRGA